MARDSDRSAGISALQTFQVVQDLILDALERAVEPVVDLAAIRAIRVGHLAEVDIFDPIFDEPRDCASEDQDDSIPGTVVG